MNRQMQPQWSISGILEASLDRVWEGLLDAFAVLYPQARSQLRQEGSPETFKIPIGTRERGEHPWKWTRSITALLSRANGGIEESIPSAPTQEESS